MQVCDSCGACRESEWKRCPFCRSALGHVDAATSTDHQRFDALAAEAEITDQEVLPSLVAEVEPDDSELDLITEQDLAHLTGDAGPSVNGWDSHKPEPLNVTPSDDESSGVDAPVSMAVIAPLVAVALAAVLFVAYSIVTTSPTPRPDAVALVDPTTTIAPISTTDASPEVNQATAPIGVDLAEQVSRLCAGEQFSIARAEAPKLATFNDLATATRDGREDWVADANQVMLRSPVPSLIGCLTTADGGEIDRCPTDTNVISRRSVDWTYRVLQTIDGAELGRDAGLASETRPCEELEAEAGDADTGFWSVLPEERIALVAAPYTTAPHPQVACSTASGDAATETTPATTSVDDITGEPLLPPALDATIEGTTDSVVVLPEGWQATDERPVEAVLCLELISNPPEAAGTDATSCNDAVGVAAVHVDGRPLGSWTYTGPDCSGEGSVVTPPAEWWLDVVGPALGYDVESGGVDSEDPSSGE